MKNTTVKFTERIMDLSAFPSNFVRALSLLAEDIDAESLHYSVMGMARKNMIISRSYPDTISCEAGENEAATTGNVFTEAVENPDEVQVFGASPKKNPNDNFIQNAVGHTNGAQNGHNDLPPVKSTLWCGYCNSSHGEVIVLSAVLRMGLNGNAQELQNVMCDILPILYCATRIYRQYFDFRDEYDSIAKVMDCIKFGIMVLNRDGNLQYCNCKARLISDRKDGIFIRGDGKVDFKAAGSQNSLRSILARLVLQAQGEEKSNSSEGVAIARCGHETVYPACVSQLDMDRLGHKYRRTHFAIIVGDPDSNLDEDLDLSSLYGLSKAEASILSGLVIGKTIDQIADFRRIKPSTVRTTLKNACRKLGVSRQQDIIRLVLTGPHGVFDGTASYTPSTDNRFI